MLYARLSRQNQYAAGTSLGHLKYHNLSQFCKLITLTKLQKQLLVYEAGSNTDKGYLKILQV